MMLAVTGDFESEENASTPLHVFSRIGSLGRSHSEVETVDYNLKRQVYLIHKEVEQTNLAVGHLGIVPIILIIPRSACLI